MRYLDYRKFFDIYHVVQYKNFVSLFDDWITSSILFIDGPKMIQSSTYVSMIIPFTMYKQGSMFNALNYLALSAVLRFLHQLNDYCFKP